MLLKLREVASLLGVSENRVYEWISSSGLPARQVNEIYGVNSTELLEWATFHRHPVSPTIFERLPHHRRSDWTSGENGNFGGLNPATRSRAGQSMLAAALLNRPQYWPSGPGGEGNSDGSPASRMELMDSLRAGAAVRGVVAETRADAMTAVLEAVAQQMPLVSKRLHAILSARNGMTCTPIGAGLAVPHPRYPMVVPVEGPQIFVAFLDQPVDFGAEDRVPVDAVFLLFSPTLHQHLRLVAKLSALLLHPPLQMLLRKQPTLDELLVGAASFQ